MEKKCIFKTNFGIAVIMTAIMLTLTLVTAHGQTKKKDPVKIDPSKVTMREDIIGKLDLSLKIPTFYVKITEHPKSVHIPNPGYYAINVDPIKLSVKATGADPILYAWFYKFPDTMNPITGSVISSEWKPVPGVGPMFTGTMTNTLTVTLGESIGFLYEFKCLAINQHNCVWSNVATIRVDSPNPR